jgi:serine/threonine protein kinase
VSQSSRHACNTLSDAYTTSACISRGDNLLFDGPAPDARLKVIDYGCSRLVSGAVVSYYDAARGAVLWRAPELLRPGTRSHTNTPAADMWSAGLILYEMATGGIAYADRRTRVDVIADWQPHVLAGRSPEEVTPLLADTPPALTAVMRACLRLDPAARITAPAAFTALCAAMPEADARRRYAFPAAAEAASSGRDGDDAHAREVAELRVRRECLWSSQDSEGEAATCSLYVTVRVL